VTASDETSLQFDLHSFNTPNGQKIIIALEEADASYRYHSIDITKGEQHTEQFRALSPDGKIPVLVTRSSNRSNSNNNNNSKANNDSGAVIEEPIIHFESGAILLHLASIFPTLNGQSATERAKVLAWTFWQVGQLGPLAGQFGRFSGAETKNTGAIEHFEQLVWRCLTVMEKRLSESPFLAGDSFTVADIASLPWIASDVSYLQKYDVNWKKCPSVVRWVDSLIDRPSVIKAFQKTKKD